MGGFFPFLAEGIKTVGALYVADQSNERLAQERNFQREIAANEQVRRTQSQNDLIKFGVVAVIAVVLLKKIKL